MAKAKDDEKEGDNEKTPSDTAVRKRTKKDKDKPKEKKDKTPREVELEPVDDKEVDVIQPKPTQTVAVAPKIFTTREIGKLYLDRESYLKVWIREMLIFFVFLIVLGILATGHHSSNEYYLSRTMSKVFTEKKFKSRVSAEILNYNEINTVEHIWEYMQLYMRNTLWSYWYSHDIKIDVLQKEDKGTIMFENKLIGRPRIRQLRVKSDSCTVPGLFKDMLSSCYAKYSSGAEDTAEYGPSNPNSTAFKYASASELGSLSVSGEISTYGGGGYYYDLSADVEQTNDTLKELFTNLWLDRGTRALILQFTTYSVNENVFFTLILLLEFPPTGGVLPSYITYMHTFLIRGIWDILLLVFLAIFILFVLWYTIEELFEIMYFRLHYFDSFWNCLDFFIIILSYLTIGFFIYQFLVVQTEIKDLIKKEDEHACFDRINSARETFITLLAILFFFAAVKALKYLCFNHSMYQMQTTLSKATKDIACFSVIFFIVFISFAHLGHLLFGGQVIDFRSFTHSLFALLRTAVGDFDYNRIESVNHFLGPIFFFAYIFFIYFILVNMFLAIIIDTYSEVRNYIRDQTSELTIGDIFCRWIRGLLRCCGLKKLAGKEEPPPESGSESTAYNDIKNLLKRCGFNDLEIDLFFNKFDIPKDKPISQEEMREKLLKNFNLQQTEEDRLKGLQQEKDELGEKLMDRIRLLEDNITDVNYKIDLIDNKIDAIQQIRARKRTGAPSEAQ